MSSKSEKLPNCFIVGAPKSGTTSLYEYMRQHPEIHMSPVKEPHFFISETEKKQLLESGIFPVFRWKDYLRLFENAGDEKVLGEATVFYLSTPDSPDLIKDASPRAKIIAILRNPIERAYSNFSHMVRVGHEQECDFSQALKLEKDRIANQNWQFFHYTRLGKYATHLKRYYEKFAGEQVKVVLTDDLENDRLNTMKDIFQFLEIDDSFEPDCVRRYNQRQQEFHDYLNLFDQAFRRANTTNWKETLTGLGSLTGLVGSRLKVKQVSPLSPDIYSRLEQEFVHDIKELEILIDRDLSGWLKTTACVN